MEQKINEIMHVMNSIEYGFRDENNKNIIDLFETSSDNIIEIFLKIKQ